MLDTNIVSELVRHPQGSVAAKVTELGDALVCTSIIVAAELRYGAHKKGSARLTDQLDRVLKSIDVLPLTGDVDQVYGRLRAYLESQGRLIGPNDLLIASQCLSLNLTLVTRNITEFARVPRLEMQSWPV